MRRRPRKTVAAKEEPLVMADLSPASIYEHCDIPPGMTIAEYRRRRRKQREPSRRERLRRRLGRRSRAA